MELTVEYLRQRHAYWIEKLADAGIWEADRFKPVELVVRERCRSYLGLFERKWIKVNVRRRLRDRIIRCRHSADMSVREIDDTLVHEMIHQYIFQNMLPDTSTHGKLFKDYMQRINEAFPQELKISIYDEAPILKGPGTRTHKLILLWMKDGECYCCKIYPSKVLTFITYLKQAMSSPTSNIKSYLLCESNDICFDDVTACRKHLSGLPMSFHELRKLSKECNIKRI